MAEQLKPSDAVIAWAWKVAHFLSQLPHPLEPHTIDSRAKLGEQTERFCSGHGELHVKTPSHRRQSTGRRVSELP